MSKRLLALTAVATAAAVSYSAALAQKAPLQKIGKGEGQVDIVAWAGYIERGATDKNFDWVTDFEKKTGCKVNVKTAGTSDEMVALMNEGGFDLVTASGDASTRLIRGKRVQPLNVSLIPSYKNVDPRLQKAPWHFENNMHYGVPYQWGWNVLMYNTKVFGSQPPTSWKVVFEEMNLPDGKSNKGRVQAFDGPIHIADAALYLKHEHAARTLHARLGIAVEIVQRRQGNGRSLASACLGNATDVAAVKQRRDRLKLDRGRNCITLGGKRGQKRLGKAKV